MGEKKQREVHVVQGHLYAADERGELKPLTANAPPLGPVHAGQRWLVTAAQAPWKGQDEDVVFTVTHVGPLTDEEMDDRGLDVITRERLAQVEIATVVCDAFAPVGIDVAVLQRVGVLQRA